MASYLDNNGLLYFWQKIKNLFVPTTRKVNNKALSADISLTASDVGALPSSTTIPSPGTGSSYPAMDGTRSLGSDAGYARVDHVHPSDTTKVDKVSGKGLSTNDFTNTLKSKLDGIESGAEVNQNAFGKIKVTGSSTVLTASAKTDPLTFTAGSNVTITPTNEGSEGGDAVLTISATDTTYGLATTSTAGLMSATDKAKLNNLNPGGQPNQNAFSYVKVGSETVTADATMDTLELIAGTNVTLTPDTTNDTVTIAATDTTYSDATTSASGLMSSSDKTKLNGIAAGAEVNQNAFSNVKVGSTTVAADGKTDTLELVAGSNVTLTPDATNDKVTIAATDTTYSAATTSTAGLMSASDKTKLDGIATGATANTGTVTSVATGVGLTGGTITGSGTIKAKLKSETAATNDSATPTNTASRQYAVTPDKSGYLSVNVPWENTTYSTATTSAAGLMSSSDKTKLNGIATGAEVNQNAFSNIKVGSTTVEADAKTDTLELVAGSNVTLTPDATNDTITIAATNTTYSDATTSASGLMSSSDKTKLNGIATGAEVNQNAFSNVAVGSTTIAADGKTDTLTLVAGSNVTLTPDATNDKITISATDTTYTAASATPNMDGTGAVGTSVKYAREDHVHPSDTTRVPTSRTVNGMALSSNITLSASDVGAIPTNAKGAPLGVCPLDESGYIKSQYLPSYVDDVIEAYPKSGETELSSTWLKKSAASTATTITPEAGKIYVLMEATTNYPVNSQFRWGGSAYVLIQSGEGVSPITNAEIDTIVAS